MHINLIIHQLGRNASGVGEMFVARIQSSFNASFLEFFGQERNEDFYADGVP